MKKIFAALFVILAATYQLACNKSATPTQSGSPVASTTAPTPVNFYSTGFSSPKALCIDSQGNLYCSDTSNYNIQKITPQGVGTILISNVNYYAKALVVDSDGTLYVANGDPGRIIHYVNGNPTVIQNNTHHCVGMAVRNGIVYWTEPKREKSTNSLYSITTSGANKKLIASGFSNAHGVALDHAGNFYVADTGTGTIVKITGGVKTNFATGLSSPWGLTFDNNGNLYVTENGNGNVDLISPNGHVTVLTSFFSSPMGIAVDNAGHVFVADVNYAAIYELTVATLP